MKTIIKGCTVIVLGVAAVACSSNPPRELQDARAAYQRAAQSPNASLAPTHIHEARQALATAEKKFEDEGDERSTRDYAYIAQRKAISANAAADTERALHDKQVALAGLEDFRQRQAMATKQRLNQATQQLDQTAEQLDQTAQQLDTTKSALSETQQQLESARRAKAEADKRAEIAFAKIEGIETKQSSRGLTVTLSGSVLFGSGKSMLLPQSQSRLRQVADALKEDKRPLLIVGHTDAQGKDEMNMELSERRAQAVKTFLVKEGIAADRIDVEGAGETQPVADNTSPEGRANNRRVEIVLQDAPSGGQQQQQQMPQQNQQNNQQNQQNQQP